MADEWWAQQKGLRQTLRTEIAVGKKAPDAELDQWAITIRYECENQDNPVPRAPSDHQWESISAVFHTMAPPQASNRLVLSLAS